MRTLHKNPYMYIAILSVIVVVFFINAMRSGSPVVEQASAEWAPEALQMAASIAADVQQYGSGAQLVAEGSKLMRESEAAAKGKDLVLCAEFKARYDRVSQQLVADENCPLL